MKFNLFKKKEYTFDLEVMRICKVCSNTFHGRYCNICGEKVFESHERSLLNFLDSLLNAFTFLDGKFIQSLKLLLTRPGQLSRNIADGMRVPYMKMVSLFFVANFFYFLFPMFDSFNSSLHTQMNSLGEHSIRAREIVKQKVERDKIDIQEFKRDYQNQSTNLSKLLIVLLVIMLTGILTIANYSRSAYFFDHLLFALEYYSFHLLINLVILANGFKLLIQLVSQWGLDWSALLSDEIFSLVVSINVFYFLIRGQQIFYKQKWYWAIARSAVIFYLIQQTVYLYRTSLFYITMWFM